VFEIVKNVKFVFCLLVCLLTTFPFWQSFPHILFGPFYVFRMFSCRWTWNSIACLPIRYCKINTQCKIHFFTLSVIGVGMRRSRGDVPLHPRYNAVIGVAARTAL